MIKHLLIVDIADPNSSKLGQFCVMDLVPSVILTPAILAGG